MAEDVGASGCELIVVFGGDGTILRGAELARGSGIPLLGVNLGHFGFLAESEVDDLPDVIDAIVQRTYRVEERLALNVVVTHPDGSLHSDWALNEVSIEKDSRARMLEVVLAIDETPLSHWRGDGLVCATPTGSTAYAWSAGGPVVWPAVEAMIVVPLSAHTLFSRQMVIGPNSTISVELVAESPAGVVWSDGRREIVLPPGSRIDVQRSSEPVRLARLHVAQFTRRLVNKFDLPVTGWRGKTEEREVDK
ncbi:MAG: NAD kinase [Rhodanobacter sp.]